MAATGQSRSRETRRKRFRRDRPPAMRLTDDDITIIRHVAKHRFLRSTHLLRLMPGRSEKKLIERLGALYHNDYLDRPRAQLDYYARAGSAPMVYALGNRGAQILRQHGGLVADHVDWTWKNRSAGRTFIEHTLLTADVMVAATRAAQSQPDLLLIEPGDIIARAPEATQRAKNPFLLAARSQINGSPQELAVVPDAVFGFDFTTDRKRKYFFVEADRGTMPVMRASLDHTSIYRKLVTYLAGGGASNAFGQQLGIGNFRVLTVTTSAERVKGMLAALQQATRGAGSRQFLFATEDEICRAPDLLSVAWIDGKGERTSIAE